MGLLSRLLPFGMGGAYGVDPYAQPAMANIPGVAPIVPFDAQQPGAGAFARPGSRANPYEQAPAPNSFNANIGRTASGPISPAASEAASAAASSTSPAFRAPPGFVTPAAANMGTPAPNNGGGFFSRIARGLNGPAFGQPNEGGFTGLDTLQMGFALMGAAQPNGGGWGAAAQSLGDIRQNVLQRERLARQDQREDEQWSWARDERAQTAERRRLAQEYINSRPEAERGELRMIDPDELGSYLQQQREFGLQERQLDLQLSEMRDNRAYRGAALSLDRQRLEQDRMLNSAESVLGRGEAERINGWMGRLDNWRMVDNDLGALDEILQRNPAAFDQILDGDQSVVLARVRDPQTRADINTIYAVSANLAREELRGQTPVSNIDFLAAVRSSPNVQSGAGFARQWLNRAYQDRADLESRVRSALDYRQGGEGGPRTLYTPDPATGRNWYQGQDGYTRYTDGGSPAGAGRNHGGRSDDAASAAAALEARRRTQANAPTHHGTLGGRTGAPRLLREPNAYEATVVRQYEEARRANNPARVRVLETRLRQRGLIP